MKSAHVNQNGKLFKTYILSFGTLILVPFFKNIKQMFTTF